MKNDIFQLDSKSANVVSRSRVMEYSITGFRAIDYLFVCSFGQRELIIGDRQTGKSTLGYQSAANQIFLNSETWLKTVCSCIFSFVSQKTATLVKILEFFSRNKLLKITSLIYSNISDQICSQFLSPLVGAFLAEISRNTGLYNILIHDDLSKHAIAYRQLSLNLKKPVGREAFPSDIFYAHARLLERSCALNSTRTILKCLFSNLRDSGKRFKRIYSH